MHKAVIIVYLQLTNYGMRLTVISDLRAKHEHTLVQQRRMAINNLLKENIRKSFIVRCTHCIAVTPSDDSSTDDECSEASGSRQDYDDAELVSECNPVPMHMLVIFTAVRYYQQRLFATVVRS